MIYKNDFLSRTFVSGIKLFSFIFIGSIAPGSAQDHRDKVFGEQNGLLVVEAEQFYRQDNTDIRKWYVVGKDKIPPEFKDVDFSHAETASGGAYLKILPDTRTDHDDKLVKGQNFSDRPGELAVLHYRVKVRDPGRYYVWVRTYSTGTEDNGIHVGIDGTWPESGKRMQWCKGKGQWTWESKRRTKEQHCGVPHKIYLDIEKPGLHDVQFSMREDGFEMDRWLMTNQMDFDSKKDLE